MFLHHILSCFMLSMDPDQDEMECCILLLVKTKQKYDQFLCSTVCKSTLQRTKKLCGNSIFPYPEEISKNTSPSQEMSTL